jgi:hypothetical protein
LTYKGETYPVKVEGLFVGEVGGDPCHGEGGCVAKLEDFPGIYAAVAAGATAGGRAGPTVMRID